MSTPSRITCDPHHLVPGARVYPLLRTRGPNTFLRTNLPPDAPSATVLPRNVIPSTARSALTTIAGGQTGLGLSLSILKMPVSAVFFRTPRVTFDTSELPSETSVKPTDVAGFDGEFGVRMSSST